MNPLVRVFLVDDHKMVRAGLRMILHDDGRILVVGEAGSKAELLAGLAEAAPDVVLLDVRLPDGLGYEACGAIKEILPAAKVLMLTSFGDDELVLQAVAAGADGYLLKEIEGPDLAQAILAIQRRGAIFDSKIVKAALNPDRSPPSGDEPKRRYQSLTPQEKRVLCLVAEGRTNKEIGAAMGLGERTVRNYFSSVLAKAGVSRRTEAAAWFIREIDQK